MDPEDVERVATVVYQPFADFGVIREGWLGSGFEELVEAGNTASVLGRAIALDGDEAELCAAEFAWPHVADNEAVLPAIPKVVDLINRGRAGR